MVAVKRVESMVVGTAEALVGDLEGWRDSEVSMDFQAARPRSSPRTSWKWSMRRSEEYRCGNGIASIRSNVQPTRCLELASELQMQTAAVLRTLCCLRCWHRADGGFQIQGLAA